MGEFISTQLINKIFFVDLRLLSFKVRLVLTAKTDEGGVTIVSVHQAPIDRKSVTLST